MLKFRFVHAEIDRMPLAAKLLAPVSSLAGPSPFACVLHPHFRSCFCYGICLFHSLSTAFTSTSSFAGDGMSGSRLIHDHE
jgi:hypothetical protein